MNRQKGITLIGLLLSAIVVILAGIVLMRMVPVYLQYYSVKQSVSALNDMPAAELSEDSMLNMLKLKKRLFNQLMVNGVDEMIKEKDVSIKYKQKNVYDVEVKYQVISPLVSHIKLLFDFDIKEEVHIGDS